MMSAVETLVPPPVRPGDTVAVVAPAGPVRRDKLDAGLNILGEHFDVRCGEGCYAATGFLAGDDDRRAEELNGVLRDPDVRAVILARGGHGITRILDRLDADALRGDPKPLVGFSDATALHGWARAVAGVRSIHGPVVEQLGKLPLDDVRWLVRMLTSSDPAGPIDAVLTAVGVPGGPVVTGPLVGGNLCLLTHLQGTAAAVDTAGAVLVIEDVGERPYAIDRYLTHLRNSGALAGVSAVACGDFTDCVETKTDPHPDVWSVIDERLGAAEVVGVRGLPVGHGERNVAWPYGGVCRLDPAAGTLELLESAVSA